MALLSRGTRVPCRPMDAFHAEAIGGFYYYFYFYFYFYYALLLPLLLLLLYLLISVLVIYLLCVMRRLPPREPGMTRSVFFDRAE